MKRCRVRIVSANCVDPQIHSFYLGAPPAYSGSVRPSRRASYAARTNIEGSGTILTDADLGTGIDTIRPVKKVDPVGSLRLSADFVGAMRKEANSPTSPISPTTHKRLMSESGKAGRSLVDEIILPILGNVSLFDGNLDAIKFLTWVPGSIFVMTWMPVKSSR